MDNKNNTNSGSLAAHITRFKWSDHTTGVGFILIFILAAIVGWPNFIRPSNLLIILRQISYTGVIALGMTLVIISGGIDLSVGSMTAFVGGITVFFMNRFLGDSVLGVAIAILFGLVFGAFCGFVNGILVTKGRIAPFIATLGTMSIFRSLIQHFSQGANVVSNSSLYGTFGAGSFLGIFIPIWVLIITAVVLHILLNNTRLGRYMCAVGANEQVARYSAINVSLIKLIPYVITGVTVAISALLWSSRLNMINSSDCSGYELDAIAAAVIGGTSMAGGKGTIIGAIMGAIILGMINNMLVLGGISAFLQQAARGVVIIAAVLLQYNNSK
jgi:ribose transport system permease protein